MRFHKKIGHMSGRCRSPIMSFNIQSRSCHAERMSRSPERSEGEASLCPSREPLRGVYPERSEGLRVTTLYRC